MESVAREIGVGVSTLERWRSDALSRPARERAWTAAARFEAVLTTAALDEAARNAWCREHGIYPQHERYRHETLRLRKVLAEGLRPTVRESLELRSSLNDDTCG